MLASAIMPTVRWPARSGAQMRAFKIASESRARGSEAQSLTISAIPRSRTEAAKRESGRSGPASSVPSLMMARMRQRYAAGRLPSP